MSRAALIFQEELIPQNSDKSYLSEDEKEYIKNIVKNRPAKRSMWPEKFVSIICDLYQKDLITKDILEITGLTRSQLNGIFFRRGITLNKNNRLGIKDKISPAAPRIAESAKKYAALNNIENHPGSQLKTITPIKFCIEDLQTLKSIEENIPQSSTSNIIHLKHKKKKITCSWPHIEPISKKAKNKIEKRKNPQSKKQRLAIIKAAHKKHLNISLNSDELKQEPPESLNQEASFNSPIQNSNSNNLEITPKSLFDLPSSGACRYIISGSGLNALYCGQITEGSNSYCKCHSSLCYIKQGSKISYLEYILFKETSQESIGSKAKNLIRNEQAHPSVFS